MSASLPVNLRGPVPQRGTSHEEHPSFAKMWMIGGQIHMEKSPPELAEAGWRIGQILKDRPVFCKLPPREWGAIY